MIYKVQNKIIHYADRLNKSIQKLSILVSFSGGMDSTVLSHLMIAMKAQYGFSLFLMHFNHGTHKKAAEMDRFCRSFAQVNKIEYYSKKLSFRGTSNFEASARDKRYIELGKMAGQLKCDIILTAHHKDDQIETLYMKKIDGADWISKIGIRESIGRIKRPFLEISKADIMEIAIRRELPWIEDPTNNDLSFRRNYVRKILLPRAINECPRLGKKLLNDAIYNTSKMHSIISNFEANRQQYVMDVSDRSFAINLSEIIRLNIEERKILLYWSFNNNMQKSISKQTRKFWNEFSKYINSARTGAKFIIGDNICFINRSKKLLVIASSKIINRPRKARLFKNKKWYGTSFCISNTSKFVHSKHKTHFTLSHNMLKRGLYIRRWESGDKVISSTSRQHQSVSDLFINNKLSRFDKLVQPIIVDKADNIVWIPGILHAHTQDKFNSNKLKLLEWLPT